MFIWKTRPQIETKIFHVFDLKLYFEYFQTLNFKELSVFIAKFWLSFLINKRASLFSFELPPQ